jgi:Ca2+-binding RTX toxin-like protein
MRVLVALLLAVGSLTLLPAAGVGQEDDRCAPRRDGEGCQEGNGRRTPGGGDKVPHTGWPAVTGILWIVQDGGDHARAGTTDNDELLGHHGSDRIRGGEGDDIIWGDWDPKGNGSQQRDVLRGGAGDDWIYPSHGARTVVKAGPGNDHVWAYYGGGTIDCGPGRDTARIRLESKFKTRNCERIGHFCAFGPDGHGGCKKPGESAAGGRRRG